MRNLLTRRPFGEPSLRNEFNIFSRCRGGGISGKKLLSQSPGIKWTKECPGERAHCRSPRQKKYCIFTRTVGKAL